ncbi:2-hydroxyacid dehydrogenase [Mangrovibacillus cuniculi]|uniref:D-glycerate dehydrogenase n=1 Tax=Mangrovibacillus cuniculi TaxID=2593652 RepID=A0A7S8CCC9_9BACI|nr:D-glycerate dehydrogenase [Mangrovibacillus cuniculi]QPC47379.1 D-glycerate dehydrogenase [Mangrovibacillus cuniculi]
MRIYSTRKLPEKHIQSIIHNIDGVEVEMWPYEDKPISREELVKQVEHADGLITMLSDSIDEEILAKGTKLKVVANLAVGFDNINLEAARKHQVVVCNTPDVLTETTADLTFGLLMATARRFGEAISYIKNDQWNSWSPYLLAGQDIHHKTIGIFGMGAIGEAVARRARGFSMNVLYHNRTRKEEAEKSLPAQYVSLNDLAEQSDFVVSLAPLTNDTKNTFNKEFFQKMKSTAIFVNAGRGPVMNEADLYDALTTGKIAGAGLDVFEKEPIGANHPLVGLPNVVAIPHIGSASIETRTAMIQLCFENVLQVLQGKEAKTPVKR